LFLKIKEEREMKHFMMFVCLSGVVYLSPNLKDEFINRKKWIAIILQPSSNTHQNFNGNLNAKTAQTTT